MAEMMSPQTREKAEIFALEGLTWLVGQEEGLGRFLDQSGIAAQDLRENAGSPEMGMAVLDFLLAVIRRTKEGRHPFSADKQHLHHRMLAIGHTHRQAVLIFWYWAFVLAFGAVSLVFVSWEVSIAPFSVLVAIGLVFSVWPRVRARRLGRRHQEDAEVGVP